MEQSTTDLADIRIKVAVLMLSLVLLGSLSYGLWDWQHPLEIIDMESDPSCDLRAGPCITRLMPGASVSFSIEPRSIPLLQTLTFEVRISGLEADAVRVDFNGIDMNMGINTVTTDKIAAGHYRGTTALSVCVRDAMQWQALVSLDSGGRRFKVPYRFITVK